MVGSYFVCLALIWTIAFRLGKFEEAALKAKEENKPLFIYIHDHTVNEWKDVDLKVLTDSLVQSKLK